MWDDPQIDSADSAPAVDDGRVGLAAVAGAMAGWEEFEEVMAAAITTRSVARERDVPELE